MCSLLKLSPAERIRECDQPAISAARVARRAPRGRTGAPRPRSFRLAQRSETDKKSVIRPPALGRGRRGARVDVFKPRSQAPLGREAAGRAPLAGRAGARSKARRSNHESHDE